jgi:hypothetical protein
MSYSELKELSMVSEQELLLAMGRLSREDKIFHFETEDSDYRSGLSFEFHRQSEIDFVINLIIEEITRICGLFIQELAVVILAKYSKML